MVAGRPLGPIVEPVTALSYLLLVISVGLLLALLYSWRHIARLTDNSKHHSATNSPGLDLPNITQDAAASIRSAAQLAPLGIVIQSASGERVFENDAAAAYTTSTADDAFIRLRLRNLIAESRERGDSVERRIEIHGPSPRMLAIKVSPLLAGEERVGTVAFIEDLTDASRVDSMRSDFIANASHELKTPLGAMRLLADALVATDPPDLSRDLAQRIQGEAGRMTRLVEDILDLALEEEAAPEFDEVDICSVIDDAVAQLELLMETAAVTVDSSCTPVQVTGNHRRLVSAVANLIENAINFTAATGTENLEPVSVRAWKDGPLAMIEVEDHGIGIPGHHQDRIFERFYRVDRGRSRASGGTGLGLAIARHVVENHNGKISMTSVSGEGSNFRIALPAMEE